jgi:hypothetical protein
MYEITHRMTHIAADQERILQKLRVAAFDVPGHRQQVLDQRGHQVALGSLIRDRSDFLLYQHEFIPKISSRARYGTELDQREAHVVKQADGPDVGLLVVGGQQLVRPRRFDQTLNRTITVIRVVTYQLPYWLISTVSDRGQIGLPGHEVVDSTIRKRSRHQV